MGKRAVGKGRPQWRDLSNLEGCFGANKFFAQAPSTDEQMLKSNQRKETSCRVEPLSRLLQPSSSAFCVFQRTHWRVEPANTAQSAFIMEAFIVEASIEG
jgi:hypothetical protein